MFGLSTAKTVAISVVGTLLIILAIAVYVLAGDNKDLNKTNTEQSGQIQRMDKDRKVDEVSQKVTEKVEAEVVQEVEKSKSDQEVVKQEVEENVQVIKKEYEAKPVTPANTKQRDDSVSTARLNGLWKLYCGGVQDEARCPK